MALKLLTRKIANEKNGLKTNYVRFYPSNVTTDANLYKVPMASKIPTDVPRPIYGGRHIVTMLPGLYLITVLF